MVVLVNGVSTGSCYPYISLLFLFLFLLLLSLLLIIWWIQNGRFYHVKQPRRLVIVVVGLNDLLGKKFAAAVAVTFIQ